MKFSLAIVIALISVAYALPNAETPANTLAQRAADRCGAAGSCHGFGGGELCDDRCRKCSGPSGTYDRGECCGTLEQACCCFYD